MSRKMLINASHPEENRVAIVVDGTLSELDIELAGQQQTKGNIYKAVVARVEPGLQAAFVDYGAEKHGFLQTGEIHPDLHPKKKEGSKERPRINDILRRGQEILVQVVKEERGTKGAALTTYLSLPGRYMVLMPDSTTKGVSRKIQDDKERKALKKTMAQLDLPDEMGYIVRTAGIGKEEAELKRDFNYLVSLYKGILAHNEKVKAPAQLYQESDIVIRSIRDYFTTDMDEVLIDDPQVYQQARDFFSLVMPEQLGLVKQHREKRPIFSRYQIEEQIESLSHNQVQLPSGGSIVIDQTEALVAIDVNSGRMAGEKGIEATAARSNIEAAAEVGRQLRLRDLGGLVVIDFIDMRDRKKIREVEQTLWQSVKNDKARVTTGRISQFGLLEMSRQRIRPALSVGAYLECPTCKGKGRIKSPEAQAVALLRQLHAAVSKGQIGSIEATVPLDVANYLLNERRQSLTELEKRFDLKILIYGSTEALPEEVELELKKREKTIREKETEEGPISHAIGLEEALAAANAPEETPSEPETVAQKEESPDEATAPTEGSGRRRRRRRRRRRGGSGGGEDQTAEQAASSSEETATTNETAAADSSEETSQEPTEKPRGRGRRPRRKSASETVTTELTTETAGETPAAVGELASEAEKPKRTRKGTAKKTEETPSDASGETPAAEEKPKRRTRRAPAKKTEETPAAAANDTPAAEEKPKRRTRKAPAKKTEEAQVSAANETPVTEEKPKRRTRRAPTKKAEEAPVAATNEAPVTEEKPKRRTRRAPAKKTEEAPVATTNETPVTEEKPKRRTRRAPAKKTEEAPVATINETPVTEEKPKRRTRRAPAKKTEEAPAAATSETPATEEKPKRRTRRAPAKKTDEAPAATTGETPSAEEKPKRRPRKAPTKKAEEA